MNLRSFEGKKVRVITTDGDECIGKVGDYIWPEGNEDFGGCEAIILDFDDGGLCQINGPEIASIKILE